MLINKLAILGVGLIGGSLALALKREAACATVVGFGRNEANLKKAVELGVIDNYAMDAAEAVAGADVIVLATPLTTTEGLLLSIRDAIKTDAIITDVGSVKGSVVDVARRILTDEQLYNFVPGHPIAGTEKSGVAASFAELFEKHLVILTPLPQSNKESLDLIDKMWQCTGARVVSMDIAHHDDVLAATSHLPHMLAYALVDCLAAMQERDELFRFAAGGFRDFSRIASSNPEMWHDVCLSNRDSLLKVLDSFDAHLKEIKHAIEEGDSQGLLEIFTRAKKARDEFTKTYDSVTINNAIE